MSWAAIPNLSFPDLKDLVSGRRGPSVFAASITLAAGGIWYFLQHPVVAVAFGLLPFAIYVVLRWPFLIVLFFVLFSFFRLHEVFPVLYPFRLPQLLALGALSSLAWNILTGKLKPYWSREHTTFALFFLHVAIGVMFATNRSVAMDHLTGTYAKIAVMVLAISWLLNSKREIKLVSLLIPLTGILVGLVVLWNKHHGISLVEGTRVTIGKDIGSMLGDPNDLALVLLFPTSFALSLITTPGLRKPSRFLGVVTYGILFLAILATQSRGGLLGIVAVTGIYVQQRIRSKAVLMLVAFLALSALFAVAGIADRQSGGSHEEGIDESAMGRIHAWVAAMRMAVDNPLTGVGMNNFYYNYYQYSDFWDGKAHAVHSTYFGVLGEAGVVGFLIFITLIILTLRLSRRLIAAYRPAPHQDGSGIRYRNDRTMGSQAYLPEVFTMAQAIWAGLIGFLVSGTFLTQAFIWPFYIIFAFALGGGNLLQKERLAYAREAENLEELNLTDMEASR